jgi:hypothetical protein
MANFLVAVIGSSVRFTIGWYAARCFILVGSCMVLSVLLVETMFLYSRFASAIILQRREGTNRLLSVEAATAAIAHEIKQPLGSMSLNCDAALECLNATPLDLDELRSCLTDVKTISAARMKWLKVFARCLKRPLLKGRWLESIVSGSIEDG